MKQPSRDYLTWVVGGFFYGLCHRFPLADVRIVKSESMSDHKAGGLEFRAGDEPSGAAKSPAPGFSTLSVHAGEERQKPGDAMTDAIFCTSTYTFASTQNVIEFIEQDLPREEYGRYGNPSEKVVERKLAALENGEEALLFASGMAAIVGLLMAKLNAGDEVIFFNECYHRSREFCTKHLARFGVVTHQVACL